MKHLSIICLLFISFTSCQEFLDIKPHEEVIPESAEEFSALLHTLLNDLDYGNSVLIPNTDRVASYESACDNLEVALTQNGGSLLQNYIGDICAKNETYSSYYEIIRDCNIIFGEMKDTESEMANLHILH